MNFHIRLAAPADVAAINDIYNHYVRTSTATYQEEPSTLEERTEWLRDHDERHPVTVAVDDSGRVLGWASLGHFKARSAYRYTVENSIYVHHDFHGKGLGRALLADLVARGKSIGLRQIVALISADQPRSITLHERAGFTHAGRLKEVGFKFGRPLDLALMQYSLESH